MDYRPALDADSYYMYTNQPLNTADETHKLKAIDAALGTKDPYTQGHARRVAAYAERLARRIGLKPEEVHEIGLGGLLHDIGKIGLSEQIFNNRAGNLCKEMKEEVRSHPYLGVLLMQDSNFPEPVLDYIYYHHERMDGSGYPCGLKAVDIPLGAKIIAVADFFEAITSKRHYRAPMAVEEAFELLWKEADIHLERRIINAFVGYYSRTHDYSKPVEMASIV